MKSALEERFLVTFGRRPDILARAPGRIEFIGNHTDYNGGTVLGAAIDRSVWVGVGVRGDDQWNFASGQESGVTRRRRGDFTKQSDGSSWVNYPLGVLQSLELFGLGRAGGMDYLAMADLPAGAGLSSSAAIEMASAFAFARALGKAPACETLVKAARH